MTSGELLQTCTKPSSVTLSTSTRRSPACQFSTYLKIPATCIGTHLPPGQPGVPGVGIDDEVTVIHAGTGNLACLALAGYPTGPCVTHCVSGNLGAALTTDLGVIHSGNGAGLPTVRTVSALSNSQPAYSVYLDLL